MGFLKKHFLLALLLICPFLMQAQVPDTTARKAVPIKVAVVQNGRYSSVLYTVNNEPLTNSTLKAILNSYPKSAEELRKFKAQKRLAYLMLPVFVAATIVGGTQADKQRDVAGSPFSKAPLPFSISVGTFIGVIAVLATNNHFSKAIEAYNSQFK